MENRAWRWINEPQLWDATDDTLQITSLPNSDFWRKTHYGFIRHSGHARLTPVTGDFSAEISVIGEYAAQYDQAGLLIYVTDQVWLKCGIEFVDGRQLVSAVVTNDFSDWSVASLQSDQAVLRLRIEREGTTIKVEYATADDAWSLLRVCYLPLPELVEIGPMAASPDGPGFNTTFRRFLLSQPRSSETP